MPAPGTKAMAASLGDAKGAAGSVAVPVGVATGVAAGEGVAVGPGVGVGAAVAAAVGRAVGAAVGRAVATGFGVGLGVGFGVGLGVGGSVMVTEPPLRLSLNRSRLIASKVTACVPAGSLPDQVNRTPPFQSVPPVVIAWAVPATRTRTQSTGEPSRLRYVTENEITVAVVPLRGDADPSESRVGPAAADTGATNARSSAIATTKAPRPNDPRAGRPDPSPEREREETDWARVGRGILFARMGPPRSAGNGTGVRSGSADRSGRPA